MSNKTIGMHAATYDRVVLVGYNVMFEQEKIQI